MVWEAEKSRHYAVFDVGVHIKFEFGLIDKPLCAKLQYIVELGWKGLTLSII
jgi:hypothetical protein